MRILDASDPAALDQASRIIQSGQLVILPTETVYGLAANAKNEAAISKIYKAKGRPSNNPLIIHVASLEMAKRFGQFSPLATALAEKFWPGPLTLVVPKQGEAVAPAISAGNSSIAIRWPIGTIAQLANHINGPIAAPSANLSGKVSATRLSDIAEDFEGKVELALEADHPDIGIESTIALVGEDSLRILRPGAISKADLSEALPETKILDADENNKGGPLLAPGMMSSHYAPNARIRLNAHSAEPDEAYLAFGPVSQEVKTDKIFQLSQASNLAEAARNLYQGLHQLDRHGVQTIAIAPIPSKEIGIAILDRLSRAAAPN